MNVRHQNIYSIHQDDFQATTPSEILSPHLNSSVCEEFKRNLFVQNSMVFVF